jgi:hypothetical protein
MGSGDDHLKYKLGVGAASAFPTHTRAGAQGGRGGRACTEPTAGRGRHHRRVWRPLWRLKSAAVQGKRRGAVGSSFGRRWHGFSLFLPPLRHVDAGSCNGCEHELTLLSSPLLRPAALRPRHRRLPRHADVLLVTGPVTSRIHEPLLVAYTAMPEPRRSPRLQRSRHGGHDRRPARHHPSRRPAHPRLSTDAGGHRAGAFASTRPRSSPRTGSSVGDRVAGAYVVGELSGPAGIRSSGGTF